MSFLSVYMFIIGALAFPPLLLWGITVIWNDVSDYLEDRAEEKQHEQLANLKSKSDEE